MEKTNLTTEQLITKQLEVLQETTDYYSEDTSRRAVVEKEKCKYLTQDGRMCAVGRCLTQESIEDVLEYEKENNTSISADHAFDVGGKLKPEYSELQDYYRFWNRLQTLHDDNRMWNGQGLSEDGEEVVDELRQRIKEGNYV